jgi:dUTP pyrophosphatase
MHNQQHNQQNGMINIPTLIEDENLLPSYMTAEAAGADVKAYLQEPLIIPPGQSALISTGMRLAIPEGYEIQVRPRSGLALKHQVTVLNTPGTIDSDYRGEIKIILINHGTQEFIITPGMRIAQLVLAPVLRANFIVNSELAATGRGMGGFGHTGVARTS